MKNSILSFNHVTIRRSDGPAIIAGMNFSLAEGDRVRLCCTSLQASALLAVLSGLQKPAAGSITVLETAPQPGSTVSVISPGFCFCPELKLLDNMLYPQLIRRIPRKVAVAHITELATAAGMEDALHRYPDNVSPYKRTVMKFISALSVDPVLLVADNPFSDLTADECEKAACCLNKLFTGTTALLLLSQEEPPETLSCETVVLSQEVL